MASPECTWTLFTAERAVAGLFVVKSPRWKASDGRELLYLDVWDLLGNEWIVELFDGRDVPAARIEEAYRLVRGYRANPATWYSASTVTPNTDVFVADAAADSGVSLARLEGWEADLQALIEQGDLEIDTGGPMR